MIFKEKQIYQKLNLSNICCPSHSDPRGPQNFENIFFSETFRNKISAKSEMSSLFYKDPEQNIILKGMLILSHEMFY